MRIVLRIGGSVVASPINSALLGKYAEILAKLKDDGHEMGVVVGGGAPAREFIKAARELGLEERDQDDVAISISRIVAQLLVRKLGEIGCRTVPSTVDEAVKLLKLGKIVVMGGLKPGMTTDAVAALLAEKLEADLLVKATDQDGVYDKDPKKHSDAIIMRYLPYKDLSKIFEENRHKAGLHQIIDPKALKILKRLKIRLVVVNGFNPENVLLATKGERIGTIIE